MKSILVSTPLLAALALAGCKSEVNVIDVAADAGYACVLHERSPQHPLPIECFGSGSSLPVGEASTLGNQWQATLENPVSLAIRGTAGVCVVDENASGQGQIRCIDHGSPSLTASRLLPDSVKGLMQAYDFSRVEMAFSSSSDFYACALGHDAEGKQTLFCWTQGTTAPVDLVNDIAVMGVYDDLTEIRDFSMGREQLCIAADSVIGTTAQCMIPTIISGKLQFDGVHYLNNNATHVAALGAVRPPSVPDQRYCWLSSYGDVGCQDEAMSISTPGDYIGVFMGPKESPSFRADATMCVTTASSVDCVGEYAAEILQPNFVSKAQHISRLVIGEGIACYLAKPQQRSGVVCEGFPNEVVVPAHLAL